MKRISNLNAWFNRQDKNRQQRLTLFFCIAFAAMLAISIYAQPMCGLYVSIKMPGHVGQASVPRLRDSITKQLNDSLTHQYQRYGH